MILPLMAGRVIYRILSGWLNRITKRLKSQFIPSVIKVAERPTVWMLSLFGIRIAFATLTLSEAIGGFVFNTIDFYHR